MSASQADQREPGRSAPTPAQQAQIVRQIHIQDCYERLGAAGGIKAVLPYYDIQTQSSLPTLVNLDSMVTNTAKSAAFFEALFLELKRQLQTQNLTQREPE